MGRVQIGLVQCWNCEAVQRGRIRRCDKCQGGVEMLCDLGPDGKLRHWLLDLHEYRRRGIVVKGYVNDLKP
jgi:hypothetical protein